MNSLSTIARVARLAQSLLSTAGSCSFLLFVLQLAPAAARAQVTFNGLLATQATGFVSPSGVAVDASGDLFVTDLTRTSVTELPFGGGSPISLGSGFSGPQGVAVDASGNVYVADKGNNAIKQIVAAGGYITINTLGSVSTSPLASRWIRTRTSLSPHQLLTGKRNARRRRLHHHQRSGRRRSLQRTRGRGRGLKF